MDCSYRHTPIREWTMDDSFLVDCQCWQFALAPCRESFGIFLVVHLNNRFPLLFKGTIVFFPYSFMNHLSFLKILKSSVSLQGQGIAGMTWRNTFSVRILWGEIGKIRGKYLTVSCNKPLKINNLGKKWKKTKKLVEGGGGMWQSLSVASASHWPWVALAVYSARNPRIASHAELTLAVTVIVIFDSFVFLVACSLYEVQASDLIFVKSDGLRAGASAIAVSWWWCSV